MWLGVGDCSAQSADRIAISVAMKAANQTRSMGRSSEILTTNGHEFENDEIRMPNHKRMTNVIGTPFNYPAFVIPSAFDIRLPRCSPSEGGCFGIGYRCPSGVVTSVPAGGLNSNVDGGIGARVWFEYVVAMRSPFGNSMSVRSTRNFSLIRRSSF
jgi:hypothetical protein